MGAPLPFSRREAPDLTQAVRDFPSLDEGTWLRAGLDALTTAQAAAEIGVSRSTVLRAINRGQLEILPGGVAVRGSLRGREFAATRERQGTGVPWMLTFLPEEPAADAVIRSLRERVAGEAEHGDASGSRSRRATGKLWRLVSPRRWIGRTESR